MLDLVDRKILGVLRENARTSKADISRRVGLTPTAVHERLSKLERSGVVRGYDVRLDAEALGLAVTAYVFVTRVGPAARAETGKRLAMLPEVEEVSKLAGAEDFLVKVRVADTKALARLLDSGFGSIESVGSTRTAIVLDTILDTRGPRVPAEPDGSLRDVTTARQD